MERQRFIAGKIPRKKLSPSKQQELIRSMMSVLQCVSSAQSCNAPLKNPCPQRLLYFTMHPAARTPVSTPLEILFSSQMLLPLIIHQAPATIETTIIYNPPYPQWLLHFIMYQAPVTTMLILPWNRCCPQLHGPLIMHPQESENNSPLQSSLSSTTPTLCYVSRVCESKTSRPVQLSLLPADPACHHKPAPSASTKSK